MNSTQEVSLQAPADVVFDGYGRVSAEALVGAAKEVVGQHDAAAEVGYDYDLTNRARAALRVWSALTGLPDDEAITYARKLIVASMQEATA